MKIKECPICGSENIEAQEAKTLESSMLFDGTLVKYEDVHYSCPFCEEAFSDENAEDTYKKAKNEAIKNNANIFLSRLKENFKSLSNIERVFQLPQRTTQRWKTEGVTSVTYSFLSLIGHFPWLVEIAESRFDRHATVRILTREAEKISKEVLVEANFSFSKRVTASANCLYVNYQIDNSPAAPPSYSFEDVADTNLIPVPEKAIG